MEILSTGEKIKRTRVYKGITLKELCGDKISISKMSCIENDKIKADEDTLKYISKKLQLDYSYLVEDVYDQLKDNLEVIKKQDKSFEELEEIINYNLQYATNYDLKTMCLDLMHLLFNLYIDNNKLEDIHSLITRYYDLYKVTDNYEHTITYYNDMALFFMKIEEYHEAISYFYRIRKIVEDKALEDKTKYLHIYFKEGLCYKMLNETQKAYDLLRSILEYVEYFDNDKDKGDFYQEFTVLNILLYKIESEKYFRIALKYKENNENDLANFKEKIGTSYFHIGEVKRAVAQIKQAIEIYPKKDKKGYANFLVRCIETLYKNSQYDEATIYNDEALDVAIDINEDKLIEKAYYFKGMIYQKKKQYIQAEMYMNLATDIILRYANKEEKYKRYNEMAELYYNIGELKESLKYFMLAVNLEKKL